MGLVLRGWELWGLGAHPTGTPHKSQTIPASKQEAQVAFWGSPRSRGKPYSSYDPMFAPSPRSLVLTRFNPTWGTLNAFCLAGASLT